ncbi:MAG: hypothetical protein WCL04_09660 [Verrucomicrobiota bacterium]
MPDLHHQKIALEELLRLKRTERPDTGFWADFERQLRTKQLAALVSRPAWWSVSWARVRIAVVRVVAPIGATAAVILTTLNFNSNGPIVRALASKAATVVVDVRAVTPAQTNGVGEQTPALPRTLPTPQPAVIIADAIPASQPVTDTMAMRQDVLTQSQPGTTRITTPWSGTSIRPEEAMSVAGSGLFAEPDVFVAPAPLDKFTGMTPAGLTAEPLYTAKTPGYTASTVYKLMAMFHPSDGADRLAAVSEAGVQARERVRSSLDAELLSAASPRTSVAFERGALSMKF